LYQAEVVQAVVDLRDTLVYGLGLILLVSSASMVLLMRRWVMFGPFESVVLGLAGIGVALGVLQWGVWALRFGARSSTGDEGFEWVRT
jgi:hypothetical protein